MINLNIHDVTSIKMERQPLKNSETITITAFNKIGEEIEITFYSKDGLDIDYKRE